MTDEKRYPAEAEDRVLRKALMTSTRRIESFRKEKKFNALLTAMLEYSEFCEGDTLEEAMDNAHKEVMNDIARREKHTTPDPAKIAGE